ncbi:Major royal jelly protein 5 [Trachymyrmex septentrionalis]|uniref:Major royal jelly protein 5 n=1 Tax=Trachymyrmex septentrionalis TaxID=34720 RepID=A0A195FDV7_9HYME|nr:Major royal jelly protein 5 [Trachymyrmex septentrionalis]
MAIVSFGIEVNVVHEWKYCEYEWDSQEQKEDAINSGAFNPYTCSFFGMTKANDGRIFITMPKFFAPNMPATLATVTNKIGPGGPLLRPYPNWSWYNSSCTCDGIIQCNYIFVLDSGTIITDQVCNPKLLIFDLENDTLVKTIYIPLDIAFNRTGSGLLAETLVFIADSGSYGLVVYDSSKKRMCRVESDYMKPTDTSFSVADKNFTLEYDFYYTVMSGKEIYKISIKTLLKCPNKKKANKQTKLVIKLSSQTVQLTSMGHSIFYSLMREMSIVGTKVYKESDNNTVATAFAQYVVNLTKTINNLIQFSMFKIINRTLEATDSTSQLTLAYIKSQLNSRIVTMDRGRYSDQFSPSISSAVDNDLPTSKYLCCKSLPELEKIKLCDNNNGSIRLFKRKLRSANEIQIASIRISLCETKVRLVTTTIGSHPRPPSTSIPRPEGRLIQWGGNNQCEMEFFMTMEVSYTAMHTKINEDERLAQSIISNILAFHVRKNETRGISLAQFELRSVRIGKLENSLIDHLLIPHYPGCHACKSKFPLPSPASFAHHRDVAARKWHKIQLEDQAKISYYSPPPLTVISMFSETPIRRKIEGPWRVMATWRYLFDQELSKGADRIRIRIESKSENILRA